MIDAAHSIGIATKVLEQLIARGVADVIGLRIETGDQERIRGSIREWLGTPGYADAIAIDLRTPGEAVLAHADVLCRVRYARDRVDFTVTHLACDGPAMHDVAPALEHFAKEHRP
ncbi:MAG: hypothetical protein ACM31C_00180 [Acidobacteriota bacterium]